MSTAYRSRTALAMEEAPRLAGMSQAAFARALGTSASRFSTYVTGDTVPNAELYIRATSVAHAINACTASRTTYPWLAAVVIHDALKQSDEVWAWRALLQCRDHTELELQAGTRDSNPRLAAWDAAPPLTGNSGWDALLAELVKHAFLEAGQDAPDWTYSRPLASRWQPEHPFMDPSRVVARTPRWLAEANIYVPERDLVTA